MFTSSVFMSQIYDVQQFHVMVDPFGNQPDLVSHLLKHN